MTTEQLLLLAIKKNISPIVVFGEAYTAFQIANMISDMRKQGLVDFNEDFELILTSDGNKRLYGGKKYTKFFQRKDFLYKTRIKEFEIYFPKKQNLLQTTSEHIHKNI